MPQRDATLQQEMVRQQNNERLRRQFAAKANGVGQWIERHLDMVASVGIKGGSLEDHLSRYFSLKKELQKYFYKASQGSCLLACILSAISSYDNILRL